MQTSQVQDPPALGFINLAKRSSTGAAGVTGAGSSGGFEAATPGLGDSQATHFSASAGLEIMQTSQTQEPPTLGFMNLANKSSTGLGSAGSFFSFSLSCSFWFSHFTSHFCLSSSFLASAFPDPNVKPESSAVFESVPFVWGLARKLKASATATLLVEENPPKLEKMFFFWSSFRFLLLAFFMTRP